jgi:hypothetical protein
VCVYEVCVCVWDKEEEGTGPEMPKCRTIARQRAALAGQALVAGGPERSIEPCGCGLGPSSDGSGLAGICSRRRSSRAEF